MIHIITYYLMTEYQTLAPFGKPVKGVNPWDVLHDCLEHTDDTAIFVVTKRQMNSEGFLEKLKKYDLEKFLIVDHRDVGLVEHGITNRNYPEDKLKLKLFVLKGKGEKQNA